MNILGLSMGELSTAALMVDGTIVASASEERFSRLKNEERYPRQAIEYCLREAAIDGRDLDLVAIAGKSLNFSHWVTRSYSTFSMQDHVRAQREYWYPRLYEGKSRPWTEVFKDKLDLQQFPSGLGELLGSHNSDHGEDVWPKLKEKLDRGISEHLGIPKSKIVHVDHHTCHGAYAYWGSPLRHEPTLVLTADAWGDDLSATISVAANDKITRVHSVPHTQFRLARLYRYITLLLGMKPNEHEYKVMGLAAYAKPDILEGPYRVFARTMFVDGLGFGWHDNPPDMYFYFKDRLEGYRFDGIAGGLQKYLEEILRAWVANAIERTGIRRVVFSGGIAMNVKAHKVLHELGATEDLFVCGSGSDESLALGICYHLMADHCQKRGVSTDQIRPHSYYIGPGFSSASVRRWVQEKKLQDRYEIEFDTTAEKVAGHLAAGFVIGRSAGRMEFGQRALGNRSILADPRNPQMIEKINRKIKNRDFWMPFAPTILAEHAPRYLVNPKNIKSPAMTIAFDSTKEARTELGATLHPADRTLRPQTLESSHNPDYHKLISAFERLTGVGAVLNTSFNLHGEPIVCSPDDALHVFANSEIDMILVEDVLIKKKLIPADK